LDAVFRGGELAQAAQKAVYHEELAKMCESLDRGNAVEDESLDRGNAVEDEVDGRDERVVNVDVGTELQLAWNLDRASALEAKSRVLDSVCPPPPSFFFSFPFLTPQQTLTAFTTRLVPSLTALHDALARVDADAREGEAFAGALGEEIEKVVDDVRQGAQVGELDSTSSPGVAEDDTVLEEEVTRLLKRLKGDLLPTPTTRLSLIGSSQI
jgi:hypothetical protein